MLEKVRSVTPLPIKFAFGTHSHADHSGGNPEVARTAVLISHRNMRNEMIKGKQPAPPTVVFDSEISIFLGGVEVRAYHFADPAHTTGDTVVYFPDIRVVQLGDLLN